MRIRTVLFVIIAIALGITVGARLEPAAAQGSPTLASIQLYPPPNGDFENDGVIAVGSEVPFSATGFYSDNSTQDLTTQVTWASSDMSTANFGANSNVLVAANAGTTQITAVLNGVTSPVVMLTVNAGTLLGVAITPAAGGVAAGSSLQLAGYGNYQIPGATNPYPTVYGNVTHEMTWGTSDSTVATVSAAGVVSGVKAGTVTVTATLSTFQATASVTVGPATPSWTLTGNLFHQTGAQTTTLLNDGTVLVAGGEDSTNGTLGIAQIYNATTGTFTPTTGSMVQVRNYATATLLPDGTVLIAGGGEAAGAGSPLDTAEIYNPSTGTFAATANNMSEPRAGATATLLNNGLVLIAGGRTGTGADFTSADLYNPSTGTFAATGSLKVGRELATATLLAGGDVLMVGGKSSDSLPVDNLSSAELYDPTAGTFTLLSSTLAYPRAAHTATLLNNGEVLIAGGGSNFGAASTPPANEELYNPTTQAFSSTGALNSPRAGHSAVLLGNGEVLLMGGEAPNDLTELFGQTFPPQATSELYNPSTGEFTFTASLNYARADFGAIVLQNGNVLAAGGIGDLLFAPAGELYPAGSISSAAATTLIYNGSTAFTDGSAGTLSAVLTQTSNASPISGVSISLTLGSGGSAQACSGTTTSNGTASCTIANVNQTTGSSNVSASFAGNSSYLASSAGPIAVTIAAAPALATTLAYNGPTAFTDSSAATLSAVLTQTSNAGPISGVSISLTLGSGGSAQSCSGTTTSNGTASCTIANVNQTTGSSTVSASFAGNSSYLASFAGPIAASIAAAPAVATTLTYNGATAFADGSSGMLSAKLVETSNSGPISGVSISFILGSGRTAQTCSGTTSSNGTATCSITKVNQTSGSSTVSASFAGNSSYLASSAGPISVTVSAAGPAATTLKYSGPTKFVDGTVAKLSGLLTQTSTGSPVTGATVSFTLGSGRSEQSCRGTTNSSGMAGCSISCDHQTAGASTVSAFFAGNAHFLASSTGSIAVTIQRQGR